MFYDLSGVKYIPDNLEEFLTARSLAYWLQDDGYQSVSGLSVFQLLVKRVTGMTDSRRRLTSCRMLDA